MLVIVGFYKTLVDTIILMTSSECRLKSTECWLTSSECWLQAKLGWWQHIGEIMWVLIDVNRLMTWSECWSLLILTKIELIPLYWWYQVIAGWSHHNVDFKQNFWYVNKRMTVNNYWLIDVIILMISSKGWFWKKVNWCQQISDFQQKNVWLYEEKSFMVNLEWRV